MRTNLQVLIAQKAQRERRRLTVRSVARELDVNPYTLYGMVNGTLRELPIALVEQLCAYLACEVGELLVLEDEPASPPDQA